MLKQLRKPRWVSKAGNASKLLLSSSLLIGALSTSQIAAYQFESEGGKVTGSFDTTVTFGAGMRLEDAVTSNIGLGNGGDYPTFNEDDGNLIMAKAIFTRRHSKTSHELELNFPTFSIFTRAMSLYDFTVMQRH